MKRIYLVYAQGCNADGTLNVKATKYVARLFTNKKLANKYTDYMNQEWYRGFHRNANFAEDKIKYYYTETREICQKDFSKMPF